MAKLIDRFQLSGLRDHLHFAAILAGLATAFRISHRVNSGFRKHLTAGNWVLQIRTADSKICRYFEFRDGQFFSAPHNHPRPDYEQVWLDPAVAAYALPHPDRTEILRANEKGIAEFYGNPLAMFFFAEAVAHVQLDFKNRLHRLGIGL